MSDSDDPSTNPDAFSADALRSLNFGPAWATGKPEQPKPAARPAREDEAGGGSRHDRGGPERRDRRGFDRVRAPQGPAPTPAHASGNQSPDRPPRNDAPQHEGRRGDFRNDGPRREIFRPAVEVGIYPEEKPFGVLLKAIKASCRTYELFEIARTILEKNERFVVSVRPLGAEQNPEAHLFESEPDKLPFLSEYDAVAHALSAHAASFFTEETVEAEPPKGAFSGIARCGFTGAFIAPPNYHGYQKALRDHYAEKIGERNMSFERFAARIETVKDEAAVAAWLDSKKKLVRYTPVERAEGDPEHFDSLDAIKTHLYSTRKDKLVKALPYSRFSGREVEKLPPGPIRATIEHEIVFQRKFPLDTANAIRGRLRKTGFSLYKRGAKGITYLCGAKRKFRTPATPPFSEEIARVFDFIERTQDLASGRLVSLSDLPEGLLGIAPRLVEAPAPAAPKPEGETAEIATTPAEAAPAHTPEETQKLHALAQNIRWLVTEGYVTEFSDGRLLALPAMTEAQAKVAAAEDEAPQKTAPAPVAVEDEAAPANPPVA